MAAVVGDIGSALPFYTTFLTGQAGGESGAVDVPAWRLAGAFGVICAQAAAAQRAKLGIGDQLVIAAIRTLVQLTLLGSILYPIFTCDNPALVIGYIFFFMVPISASDCAARPTISYDSLFRNAALSLAGAVLINGGILLLIVNPDPWYDAQYVIPMAGMLVGNALTGSAVAVNTILEHLSSKKEHVDILLAFGARPGEAAWPAILKTFHQALTPMINQMNIMGIVSIPGMMTGQVLGGSSPMKAAKYQIAIIFMISSCTTTAISILSRLTVKALFDKRGRLVPGGVVKNTRWGIVQCLNVALWAKRCKEGRQAKTALSTPLVGSDVKVIRVQSSTPSQSTAEVLLDVTFDSPFGAGESSSLVGRLEVRKGEIACLMGPSGVGKSTLLKMVADLQESGKSVVRLKGDRASSVPPQVWRKEVMYLPQMSGSLPGTPADFIEGLGALKVRRSQKLVDPKPALEGIGLSGDFLERPWNELSGGERQRVLFAIAASMSPSILLLDEPTSALDEASKKLVEEQIRGLPCAVLMVTHDSQQAGRLKGPIWTMAPE